MIVDFDDFHETNHKLHLLHALKAVNAGFRCTLFAVPALGTETFWETVPGWCELAVHGWFHPDPHECQHWPAEQMDMVIHAKPGRFVNGFKAPGWQISDGCYQSLLAHGWWLADQHYNDDRRPQGIAVHCEGDGDHWHGHIQDVCGNGVEERWDELVERVRGAASFELVSEAARVGGYPHHPGAEVSAAGNDRVGENADASRLAT